MIIIYYRNAKGEISMPSTNTGGKTFEELKQMAANFNADAKMNKGKTAYVEDFPDDSITAHYAMLAAAKMVAERSVIDYAVDCIESALSAVRDIKYS